MIADHSAYYYSIGVFTKVPNALPVTFWVGGGLGISGVLALLIHRREQVPRWYLVAQVVLTGVLLGALVLRHGFEVNLLAAAAFVVAGVPSALIDLRTSRLPNWLVVVVYALTSAGLLVATFGDVRGASLLGAAVGATGFVMFYAALYAWLPGQLGGGDVKLSAAAGAVLGWHSWPTLFAGLLMIWLLGAVAYLAMRLAGGPKPRDLPHGPFLVLGTVAAVLVVP
ncbi:prepilin peptidase [Amycolatopsis sacchari]|uniref:prepilin peptidase n=1 Tax=Amycolatopsis sacchari TaxID=115433 RepID=UPI003EBA7F1F